MTCLAFRWCNPAVCVLLAACSDAPTASTSFGSGSESSASSEATGASTGADSGTDPATTGPLFDVGDSGGCGAVGEVTFTYIWIANTDAGTVSKINTRTGEEEGRYRTGPDSPGGSPSRTSVNMLGDVAVSNRFPGSVTRIAALEERCEDRNGDGLITTSSGPMDVLDWGEDECALWNTPIPSPDGSSGPRPTAWEGGHDPDCNPIENPRLWIGFMDENIVAHFWRLDGATGDVLDEVEGPVWNIPGEQGGIGPYGGAVNRDGDLWATGWNKGHAIRIDAETLEWEEFRTSEATFYGMALDADGNLWAAGTGVARLNADDEQWNIVPGEFFRARGIGIDRQGRLWAALNFPCRLGVVDTTSATIIDADVPLPGCDTPVGVGIDVDGYVWVVDSGAYQAFKVDPDTLEVELTVTGLQRPYTYSDMTGYGLSLVTNPAG